MVFLLVGLTNKQFGDWTDPTVGGFIVVGIIGTVLFILAESRAKEPIVPLHLWKSRTYSASMVSTFFAAFAFFGAIVFLPRWFQFVEGFSPTDSGLAALPLMVGLIASSIVSGLIVSRTGRYKWLVVVSIALMGVGTLLMTQLTQDTPVPIVWLWMFIVGIGVGPTFSVFTIIIQNAVPFRELGVATSNLTFFRQIGGTIALAFVGTIFGTTLIEKLPSQLAAAGVPAQIVTGFSQARRTGPQPADRDRRGLRPGCDHPRDGARAGPAAARAVHREHRRRHPRCLQPGHRPDLLARRRRVGHRGRRGRGDQGDPAPLLERGAGLRRSSGRQPGRGPGFDPGRGHGPGDGHDPLPDYRLTVERPPLAPSLEDPGDIVAGVFVCSPLALEPT